MVFPESGDTSAGSSLATSMVLESFETKNDLLRIRSANSFKLLACLHYSLDIRKDDHCWQDHSSHDLIRFHWKLSAHSDWMIQWIAIDYGNTKTMRNYPKTIKALGWLLVGVRIAHWGMPCGMPLEDEIIFSSRTSLGEGALEFNSWMHRSPIMIRIGLWISFKWINWISFNKISTESHLTESHPTASDSTKFHSVTSPRLQWLKSNGRRNANENANK